jgi:hypothetical protein
MNKLTLTSKLSRNPDVAFTQIDDDLVMMGPDDNLFYGVNATGTKIWSLLEFKVLSLNEICEGIQQDYDVPEAQCIDDAMQFVQAMVEQNMLAIS